VHDVSAYTAANRLGWNKIAASRHAEPAQFYLDGGSTLADFEADFLPDLRGARLLHLACANGNDSLSLAALGASVTGVDISEAGVRIAQATAAGARLDARFIAADVYDLPAELGQFDVVYMSWGGICWMPDLQRWAEIVASHIRPGGILGLFEHHPVWEILAVRDGGIALAGDYFGRVPHDQEDADPAKRPAGWTSAADAHLTSFVWPVSQVLMAIMGAGLRLDSIAEGAEADMYAGLDGDPTRLPAYYVIIASKPGPPHRA
jgi:SAM-dependent methyltransferase